MADGTPTEQHAIDLVRTVMRQDVKFIRRFPTGLAHWVYDVLTEDGQSIVVRLTRVDYQPAFVSAVCWHRLLKPKGIPLPEFLYVDLDPPPGHFPAIVMERLPGEDLGIVYPTLTRQQKRAIAGELAALQRQVATLPPGPGYGFAASYDDTSLHKRWADVVYQDLSRGRQTIESVGLVDPGVVDKVQRHVRRYEDYFARVEPRGFLDDITTKNVIVHEGKLSGIVDVDKLGFGDNMLVVALTQMSLLSSKWDTGYIDDWCEARDITEEQRTVLTLYTALFCTIFLGEQGQAFNKEVAVVDHAHIQHLNQTLDMLLAQL